MKVSSRYEGVIGSVVELLLDCGVKRIYPSASAPALRRKMQDDEFPMATYRVVSGTGEQRILADNSAPAYLRERVEVIFTARENKLGDPAAAQLGKVMDEIAFKLKNTAAGKWINLMNGGIDIESPPGYYSQVVDFSIISSF